MIVLFTTLDGREGAIGSCVACDTKITFDPEFVPSLVVSGVKQPICAPCSDRWNDIHRVSKGLEPVPVHPGAFIDLDDVE